jgi:hypothetical protein
MTSPRIVSQAGAFTVHKILKDGAYRDKLVKFTLDSRLFPQFRKDLNLLGVNATSMFPDLDGICEHLEGRLGRQSFGSDRRGNSELPCRS